MPKIIDQTFQGQHQDLVQFIAGNWKLSSPTDCEIIIVRFNAPDDPLTGLKGQVRERIYVITSRFAGIDHAIRQDIIRLAYQSVLQEEFVSKARTMFSFPALGDAFLPMEAKLDHTKTKQMATYVRAKLLTVSLFLGATPQEAKELEIPGYESESA